MSSKDKILRGLIVLVVIAIMAVLVWKFATGDYFYPGSGIAVLITGCVIFVVYRKPRNAPEGDITRIEEKKEIGTTEENLESGQANMESFSPKSSKVIGEQFGKNNPFTGRPIADRASSPRADAKEVAEKYFQMAKMASETNEYSGKPVAKMGLPQEVEPLPHEAVEEQTVSPEDSGSEEPPMVLIEDETTLTEEEKNQLVNAVWYRCENPYCKYSGFLGVHHIINEKEGGTNKLDNLIVLCPYCHELAHKDEIPEKEMRDWISNREERFKFKPEWPYN
jgi:hypothetical protein